MDELRRNIKNKKLTGVHLFTGEEKFLIKRYESSFIKACLQNGTADIGLSVFEGKNVNAAGIAEAADTPSFSGGGRLVLVKESGLFTAKRKDDGEKTADFIKSCGGAESGDAVILFIEDEVDKRGKAYKAANKHGKVTEFKTPSESEIAAWALDSFKKRGLSCSRQDVIHLIRMCGGRMEVISNEIEKLSSYKQQGKITTEDMEAICTKSTESRIFDLTDAIASKNRTRSLTLYNELLSMKEQPVGILAMLNRQFGLILKCGLLTKQGLSGREIAEKLHQHPYSVKLAVAQSRSFPENTLKTAMIDCAECDVKIKTGTAEGRLGVELLIIKYTQQRES